MNGGVKVTATLGSPVLGELPFLDALIEYEMAMHHGMADKFERAIAIPAYGNIPSPILRRMIGGQLIPCCSSPIACHADNTVEYISKRLDVGMADCLDDKKRIKVNMTGGAYKSYHLPFPIQSITHIVWFAVGDRRGIKKSLHRMTSIGKKRSVGYGRVIDWTIEAVEQDWSWFATTQSGIVLMRPLPDCNDLPQDMLGARKDYGAVQPPMWHPSRYMDRVVPC